jgi:hypothetical protein
LSRAELGSRFLRVGTPKGRQTPREVFGGSQTEIANCEAAEKEQVEEILEGEREAMSGDQVVR